MALITTILLAMLADAWESFQKCNIQLTTAPKTLQRLNCCGHHAMAWFLSHCERFSKGGIG